MLLKILIQPRWAPQACGPLCFAHAVCFAHAARSIATPLIAMHGCSCAEVVWTFTVIVLYYTNFLIVITHNIIVLCLSLVSSMKT